MKLDCQFKSLDYSEALKLYAEDAIQKLKKFEMKPVNVQVIFSAQRHEKFVSVNITGGIKKYHATAHAEDFYESMDKVMHKLSRQMLKNKNRVQNHKKFFKSKEGKLLQLRPDMEFDETFHLKKTG
jgi:putative sigma-54 modulation protein